MVVFVVVRSFVRSLWHECLVPVGWLVGRLHVRSSLSFVRLFDRLCLVLGMRGHAFVGSVLYDVAANRIELVDRCSVNDSCSANIVSCAELRSEELCACGVSRNTQTLADTFVYFSFRWQPVQQEVLLLPPIGRASLTRTFLGRALSCSVIVNPFLRGSRQPPGAGGAPPACGKRRTGQAAAAGGGGGGGGELP